MSALVWLWMVPIFLVPLVPKVTGVSVGGVRVMLDDLLLLLSCSLGVLTLLALGAKRGRLRLKISPVAAVFSCLIAYKVAVLLVLGLFLPWSDLDGIGEGVLFVEGVLVLSRLTIAWLVLLLTVQVLATPSEVRSGVMAVLGCGTAVVALGLAQFALLGHTVLTSTFRPVEFIDRRFTHIENPWLDQFASGHEHLAAFCVLLAALIGGLLLTGWKRRPFTVAGLRLLALGTLFVLLFASSRGGWIGGTTALFALLAVLAQTGSALRGLRLVTVLMGCLALVALSTDVEIVGYIGNRVGGVTSVAFGGIVGDSARQRITTFLQLWRVFEIHPLIGLGPGGAGRIAEGQFIRELVEGGIVGTTIFLVMIFRVLQTGYRCYRHGQDRLTRGLGLGVVSGTSGMMAQCLFTELFVVVKVAIPFWLLVGMAERSWMLSSAREGDLEQDVGCGS